MAGEVWRRTSEEWQLQIVQFLKVRYSSPGDFIEIPDKVRGDYGIEGFARDGRAYQCYAAEEPVDTKILSQKQRTKITTDLRKLKSNASELASLLGQTRISHWILVVPRWEDKAVLSHAQSKANELIGCNLPCLASGFAPAILTGDDFAIERQKLALARREFLRIEVDNPAQEQIGDWVDENDALVNGLDRKTRKIRGGDEAHSVQLRNQFVFHFLQGKNALDAMQSKYPDLYESAMRIKADAEEFIQTSTLISHDFHPPQIMRQALGDLKKRLTDEMPGVAIHTVDLLVHEALADWLIRCPLDFPDL